VRPMLATPDDLPLGDGWAYEVKWDGMRVLADVRDDAVRLFSRTGRDVTVTFPELAPLAGLRDALLDGEVVAFDGGIPSFPALAERLHVRDARRARELAARTPVSYIVFDLLRRYGVDITARPWSERRATLERLELPPDAPCSLSPVYDDGAALHSATAEQHLEGVVAKRRTAVYVPGRRSRDWVKVAHRRTQTCLVGGWRPETGSTRRVGALLVGLPGPSGLHYLGRVGTGVRAAAAAALTERLAPLTRPASPFVDPVPRADATGATWCEPSLVVEVRHLGTTSGGRLRQPVLRGVRDDVEPQEVRAE
jgi:bifunctional non-homologous end joining protein LigD